MRFLVLGIALFVGGCIGMVAGSSAPASPAHLQLDKDEYLIEFANGCSRVEWLPRLSGDTTYWAKDNWSGECRAGLAHGKGWVSGPDREYSHGIEKEYHFGRLSPYLSHRRFSASTGKRFDQVVFGKNRPRSVVVLKGSDTLDDPSLLRLASPDFDSSGYEVLTSFYLQEKSTNISLHGKCGGKNSHPAIQAGSFPKDEQGKVLRCRAGTPFYHLAIVNFTTSTTYRLCPDTRDARSCLPLYRELIAPHRDELAALIENAPAEHERWVAGQNEQLQAAERELARERASIERRAAERRAEAERQRADEQARQAQAETEFRTTLQRGSAPNLYALADRLLEAGDTTRAREALRVLMERFPDSPLATTAANRLNSLGGSSGGATATRQAATASATPARSCESLLGDTSQAGNAGRDNLNWTQELELSVGLRQLWLRMAGELPSCRQDPAFTQRLRQLLAEKQQECRQAGGRQCDQGGDARPAQYRQAMDAAVARVMAAGQRQATNAPAAPATAGNACAGTPVQHENQRLTPAFENLQRRCPQGSGPNWGSRAEMQRVYWVMDETLKLLDQHRHCLAHLYDGYRRDITAARDQARNACDQLTSSGSCPLACPN